MSNNLFIHIIDDTGNLQWYSEGEEAAAAVSSKETLAAKSCYNFDAEVVIFVPTTDVYITRAKLPALSQVKLRKVVPYAIEDEVTTDVSACHFAISSPDSGGFTAIGVVNRERMDAWLQLLPAGLKDHISLMTPDVFGLPWKPGALTIVELGSQVLVRQDQESGFAIEKENVVEILAQFMHENNHTFSEVHLISRQAHSDLEKPLNDNLKLHIIHQTIDSSWIQFFVKNRDETTSLNLLQGDFGSKYSVQGIPRLKRIFTTMLMAWLLIMLSIGFIKFSILTFQSHQLNNQLAVIYNEIFPGEAASVSPKQRVQMALVAVKKAKEQSVFIRLVAAASPVLRNQKGISIQSAIFSNSQLEIQLEASDFQLLDKVTADLRHKGLIAEQNKATKVGSVIQSQLVIKEG